MDPESVSDPKDMAGRRLRESVNEFIAKLRLASGMDEDAFARLRAALIEVGNAWRTDSVLPKSVVHYLVGLYSWIESSSYLYDQEVASRIREAAREIDMLITERIVPASETPDLP